MESKVSTITADQLWESGWIKTNDPVFPAEKCLTDTSHPDYDPDAGVLKLVLHLLRNVQVFALVLPDGSMININPSSIEELNLFENLIYDYDPNY